MKYFEKQFKLVLNRYKQECLPVYCPDLPEISEFDFRFLSAYGLLTLTAAGDDEFYAEPTEKGITYFVDKKSSRRQRWLDKIIGFISGIAVSAISGIIIWQITR